MSREYSARYNQDTESWEGHSHDPRTGGGRATNGYSTAGEAVRAMEAEDQDAADPYWQQQGRLWLAGQPSAYDED